MQIGESIAVAGPIESDEVEEVELELEPTITAKWARHSCSPNTNGRRFPPSSPPTDKIKASSKAKMNVQLKNVPNDTEVKITIYHCHTGAKLKDGTLDNLIVFNNRVIDPATKRIPYFIFEDKHKPWDPWDKPFFYFKVEVDFNGLSFETPKDFNAKPDETMRVRYWHVCVSDTKADVNDGLSTRAEMREIARILRKNDHHRAYRRSFNSNTVPVSHWGSVIRNSYTYHQASHGSIINPAGNHLHFVDPTVANPPADQTGTWNSVLCLGQTDFSETQVGQVGNVPSVPRYLVYLNICVAGWEDSLGNAFINRGTQNFIGFRMYIPDNAARAMARKFYSKWALTHKCDPDRISQVFFDVGSAYYSSMRPVLLGNGAGQISSINALNELSSIVREVVADIKMLFR
ncbi:MAG: hypothetical protein KUG82_02890 [Pseudomonadales bacterium]|nr:hypothetical protein [Pseudomonadales bacterium]